METDVMKKTSIPNHWSYMRAAIPSVVRLFAPPLRGSVLYVKRKKYLTIQSLSRETSLSEQRILSLGGFGHGKASNSRHSLRSCSLQTSLLRHFSSLQYIFVFRSFSMYILWMSLGGGLPHDPTISPQPAQTHAPPSRSIQNSSPQSYGEGETNIFS